MALATALVLIDIVLVRAIPVIAHAIIILLMRILIVVIAVVIIVMLGYSIGKVAFIVFGFSLTFQIGFAYA